MSSFSESIEINAAPQAVFDTVSKLEVMGQFSPENTGGEWTKGATGASVGAKFKGTNVSGKASWSTTATIVTCRAPTSFAFEVTVGPAKVARWTYDIEATAGGSKVTETWIDRRSALVKKLARTPVTDRDTFTQESIKTTLAKLKEHLES
jgi:hypothetical protein